MNARQRMEQRELMTMRIALLLSLAMSISAKELWAEAKSPEKTIEKTAAGEKKMSKLFFEDDFSKDMSHWVSEGPNQAEVKDGRLLIKTAEGKDGQFVWLKKDLPTDFRVEYDVTPISASGFFLIFFCAKGVDGTDILDDKLLKDYKDLKDFKKYTIGPINCYHTSYRRNTQADCNLRKNTGKHLVKSSKIGRLMPQGKTAHVVLTKQGGQITLVVDGETFVEWTDDGKLNGKIYSEGKLGLRQVYASEGAYDNFKVFDLTQ